MRKSALLGFHKWVIHEDTANQRTLKQSDLSLSLIIVSQCVAESAVWVVTLLGERLSLQCIQILLYTM